MAAQDNNVYGRLAPGLGLDELNARLTDAGWSTRTAHPTEVEAEQEWASITIFVDARTTLLHGVVDPDRVEELSEALAWLGAPAALELYDAAGGLVRRIG